MKRKFKIGGGEIAGILFILVVIAATILCHVQWKYAWGKLYASGVEQNDESRPALWSGPL